MSYIEQRDAWLRRQKKATPEELKRMEEAWTAGYMTATDNWCSKKR